MSRASVSVLVSERDFASQLAEVATLLGWHRYHTWTSRHSAAGFPDETLVRGSRLVFAELKSEAGKLTREQRDWLDVLARTGAEVYVWRPSMLDSIVELLRARDELPPTSTYYDVGRWPPL